MEEYLTNKCFLSLSQYIWGWWGFREADQRVRAHWGNRHILGKDKARMWNLQPQIFSQCWFNNIKLIWGKKQVSTTWGSHFAVQCCSPTWLRKDFSGGNKPEPISFLPFAWHISKPVGDSEKKKLVATTSSSTFAESK